MSSHEVARLTDITKSFGAVKALVGVDLTVQTGACLGLVGYNGAGKTTLMNILVGTQSPDSGQIFIRGRKQGEDYSVVQAQQLGIRCVFQELSLCPNLSVAENTRIFHRNLKGRGWRKRASDLISEILDEIFPGHGILPGQLVGDLPIGKRQMVEIARAFTVTEDPLHLVILDEPTSSLDVSITRQLLDFIRKSTQRKLSIILISHILNEVLDSSDHIAVMRDGRIVAVDPVSEMTKDKLVRLMGEVTREKDVVKLEAPKRTVEGKILVKARVPAAEGAAESKIMARKGEIVGLSGLAGHGQTDMLLRLFEAEGKTTGDTVVDGKVAFVAGDRQSDGIFLLWSIMKNITICSYNRLCRKGLISTSLEKDLANKWQSLIRIKTPDVQNSVRSLSGGNQQKVLFARSLGSDAEIVLMDDPMRGVDVDTKREVYSLIRDEALRGRCFIWYTTEMAELEHCDRLYVFRNGSVVSHLVHEEITEDRVLQSAFTGEAVTSPRRRIYQKGSGEHTTL